MSTLNQKRRDTDFSRVEPVLGNNAQSVGFELRNLVVIASPAPNRLSFDANNYILFKLMDDGLNVCMY